MKESRVTWLGLALVLDMLKYLYLINLDQIIVAVCNIVLYLVFQFNEYHINIDTISINR